jgi:hypothetical protein
VTGVRVSDQQGTLFDGDRNQQAFTGVHWALTDR